MSLGLETLMLLNTETSHEDLFFAESAEKTWRERLDLLEDQFRQSLLSDAQM